eukprot:1159123-Pelagomonas_calceolata.AAC.12
MRVCIVCMFEQSSKLRSPSQSNVESDLSHSPSVGHKNCARAHGAAGTPDSPRKSYPSLRSAKAPSQPGCQGSRLFTTTQMSMTGFAFKPGTLVLPT